MKYRHHESKQVAIGFPLVPRALLQRARSSVVSGLPTKPVAAWPSTYWVRVPFIKAKQAEFPRSWRPSLDIPAGLSRPFRSLSKHSEGL